MFARDPLSADRKRKEKESRMIVEGTTLYKQKKLREAIEKRDEHRKLQVMLANYHPWGRPGGGAPNPEVRRRPLTLTQVDSKKGLDMTLPRVGPKPPILRRSDPILRYQLNDQVRKSIENHVRYRRPYQEQQQYKQQLDRLVADKRRLLSEERRDDRHLWGMTCTTPAPWGRPGPGGSQWREPRAIGQNFLHSLGWTGEPVFQRLEYEHELQDGRRAQTPRYPMLTETSHRDMLRRREFHPPEEMMTGGVELVPLLARRRVGYRRKELGSTDVTRRTNGGPPAKPVWKPIANEGEYLKELTCQILNKEAKNKEARTEDIVDSRRHFETWGGFWGRPGHGAPKGTVYKENLDNLLYRMPIATM